MSKFTTKPIYENRLGAYDDIQTVGADKTCLSIMIGGALIMSTIMFHALPHAIEEVEAHEVDIVVDNIVDEEAIDIVYIDTVQEDAFAFIVNYESLHTTSYWDIKRWSI